MITFRKTFLKPYDIMDDYIKKILSTLTNMDYDWIKVSDSYHIIVNKYLHYTVTITAGKYENKNL